MDVRYLLGLASLIGLVVVAVILFVEGVPEVSEIPETPPTVLGNTLVESGQKQSMESVDVLRTQPHEATFDAHRILLLEQRIQDLEALLSRQLGTEATNDETDATTPEEVEAQEQTAAQSEEVEMLEMQDQMEIEFQGQAMDEAWSHDTSVELQEALDPALIQEGVLANLECRYSMCRIETNPVGDDEEGLSHIDLPTYLAEAHLSFPEGISFRNKDGGMVFYLVREGFELPE